MALCSGTGAPARGPAQRRAVRGTGTAAGDGAGSPPVEGCRRRRPADGGNPGGGALRRSRCRRSCLPAGARRERLFGGRHPQHPGPPARSGAGRHHPHTRRTASAPRAAGRLRPLRQPQEGKLMERTEVLDLMGTLKLYGMRSAYDEIMATAIKRQHEPPRVVGDLLSAEIAEKQARSIKYQLTVAKLPLAKDVDDFDFADTPVNEA